uniref:Uncharacterized protein n=1 Tax=Avena sativa TaxID=4498 RepID=A0ACD5YWZ6_AVESA
MTLSWCCLLLQLVLAAELVLASAFDASVQLDPKDIKMTIEILRDIASAIDEQQDWEMKTVPVQQEWHKSGRQCPTGSIPITRTTPTVVNLTGFFPPLGVANTSLTDTSGAANRTEFAVAIAANGPYRGAYVLLPVWKAARVHASEFTATFLIVGGTVDTTFLPSPGQLPADITNQIGVGFFANPSFNGGDNNPRLNLFYTPDGGKSQCYNLQCGGFIQTNKAIALGASIADGATGVDDHVPYVLVTIEKDAAGPWHVLVNDTDLGYYPRQIFPCLFPEAVANLVGGAVLNTWPGGKHTDTVMGNGRRPPGDDKTAVVKGYIGINVDGSQVVDQLSLGVHTAPDCYNFSVLWEAVCRFRSEGGLGVIDLTLHNTCLLLKKLQAALSGHRTPWADWVRSNYLCATPAAPTPTWQVFASLLPLYRSITSVRVGHGRSVDLWADNWTSLGALSAALPAAHSHMVCPNGTVADALSRRAVVLRALPRVSDLASAELRLLHLALDRLAALGSTADDERSLAWGGDGKFGAGTV